MDAVTLAINGKFMKGKEDRRKLYERAIAALATFPDTLEA